MAEHLQKDAKTYNEEYAAFLREIKSFHDNRGTSFNRLPRLNGQEVDLYLLYSLVTSRGGWEKVNINGDWETLLPYFGINRLCANGSIGLKQIYVRYLDVYERIHFLGEEVDRRESELHEEDDARNRRKALRLLHTTPTSYNTGQHLIPDNMRSAAGLSTETVQVTPSERLFLSLVCPLPNEQDFAINVCSLLAMENRQPFQLQQCPRILDALLAHAGVFSQVEIRDLYTECYQKTRGQNLGRFWRETIPDPDILQLSEEDLIIREPVDEAHSSYWNSRTESQPSPCERSESMTRSSQPTSSIRKDASSLDSTEDQVSNQGIFIRPLDSDKRLTDRGPSADSSQAHCSDPHRRRPAEDPPPVQDSSSDGMADSDATPSVMQAAAEEESQCSVRVYENGTGLFSGLGSDVALAASPLNEESRSASSCEPNFRNCLSKSTNDSAKGGTTVFDQLGSNILPSFASHQKLANDRVSACEPDEQSTNSTDLRLGEQADTTSCPANGQLTNLEGQTNDQQLRLSSDDAVDNVMRLESQSQTKDSELVTGKSLVAISYVSSQSDKTAACDSELPSVEKRIPAPKYKLPAAVLKPDNPRAVRYWETQRRAVVPARPKYTMKARPADKTQQKVSFDAEDMSLFHLGRDLGVHDSFGQRVLQVLNIIRNLSFDEVNSSFLAQNEACVRLLLLAAHAKWNSLPQLAYDALSNLASEIKLEDPADSSISAVLMGTVTRGIESTDRFVLLRCMETLGRLAQRDENESVLLSSLDSTVYERLCSYLTIPDVALLIYTLECVYALSSLGQITCNSFLHCPGTLDILISLLTVEAQSYGSKARILMNVVETVAEGEVPTTAHAQMNYNPNIHNVVRPAHTNSPTPSAPSTPPPAVLQPVTPAMTTASMTPVAPTTPMNKIQQKPIAAPSPTSRPGTPPQPKPNSVSISHTEKEQIAMQWLRSTFESVVGAPSMEQTYLYKQYVATCSKNPARQVLATVQFYSCVRATFGQNVGPFRKQVGANVEFYFEGISPKSVSPAISTPAPNSPTVTAASSAVSAAPGIEVPGSPILKAQLCAPPKAVRKDNAKQLAHPHLSQALGQTASSPSDISGQTTTGGSSAGPPSSSLIKSLLANKVPDSNHVSPAASLGLSPTATALPGMNRTTTTPCMSLHAISNPNTVATSPPVATSTSNYNQQVAQRQQQQRLLQQQQAEVNGPLKNAVPPIKAAIKTTGSSITPKVNGICPEMESNSAQNSSAAGDLADSKSCTKGMLADLLEREVKKEAVPNGATLVSKEIRISDKGLELVSKDTRGIVQSVDMGVVGMDNLGVDLGDGGSAPKAAHLIAQVDDSGHVQIHLEEEPDSSMALCNGQSLLDQLEACEVSSSTDTVVSKTAVKRPAEMADESEAPAPKKAMVNHTNPISNDSGILEKAIEMTLSGEPAEKNVNGTVVSGTGNGTVSVAGASNGTTSVPVTGTGNGTLSGAVTGASISTATVTVAQAQTNGVAPSGTPTATTTTQPVILAPNAPRTFLILQPQSQSQSPRLLLSNTGQRLLFTIPRPGGGVQHVAMPANMVAISSSQLQSNGGVVTLTTTGGVTSVVTTTNGPVASSSLATAPTLSGVTLSTVSLPASSAPAASVVTATPTTGCVVTTSSMEGVVTFSGGAVAFPAPTRPTDSAQRNTNVAENHVTITPVSAPIVTATQTPTTVSVVSNPAVPASTPAPAVAPAAAAAKPRNANSPVQDSKPRPRPPPAKGSSQTASSPIPQHDPSLQFVCEWKDCMKAFKTPHEVYVHACHCHCPATVDELGCLWDRCDGLKRKRYSMMTHLMDRHCNDEMQKLLAMRRFQMSTQGKTDIPLPQAPTPHPGYAPHAALHAIKRHAVELMTQKEQLNLQEEKEGPVTKSIRLTSALILRNFATHSSLGRRCLRRYESHLASVALSNVESSRTVAQILYELTHQCS